MAGDIAGEYAKGVRCSKGTAGGAMAEKRILTIGFELASSDVQYVSFGSKISLLDWDIVLFKPIIDEFLTSGETYQGKPSLSDSSSFRLKECCEH
ncbi:MAG: hypothetical protein Q7K03_07375, partial [Dehalococcoidia bacterium]|nr:hypothetical protein [Dehalococcoidia bacterium]